jgi:hypothetical protein
MRRMTFALPLLLAGCRACFSSDPPPPPEVVEAAVKKELAAHPEKVKTLCGVSVPALRDIVVKIEKSQGTRYDVHVEGTPDVDAGVDAGEDEDDDDDAGPLIANKGKALLCAGALVVTLEAVHDDDHHVDWRVKTLEVGAAAKATRRFGKKHHHHH